MLAEKIKMLRTSQGLNQTEFAKRLFVTPGAVNQWEKGKTAPDTERLFAMAKEFSIPLDFFLDDPNGKKYTEAELIKQQLLIELRASQPKTTESRIISECVDRMPPEDREKALNVFKAVYAQYFDNAKDKMA